MKRKAKSKDKKLSNNEEKKIENNTVSDKSEDDKKKGKKRKPKDHKNSNTESKPIESNSDYDDKSEEDEETVEKESKKKKPKKASTSIKVVNKDEVDTKENGKSDNDDSEDEDYEVEEIVGDKHVRGIRHYLIRWKGYDKESDTWEPESTLNCPDLIKKYNEVDKKNKSKKSSNTSKPSKEKTNFVEDWDENEEFEVDRILEVHHKRDGKREFLVSWKGYSHTQDSWEPEENLTCNDLIDKFMRKVEQAKEIEQHNLREKRKHTDRFTLVTNDSGRRLSRRFAGKQRMQYHDLE